MRVSIKLGLINVGAPNRDVGQVSSSSLLHPIPNIQEIPFIVQRGTSHDRVFPNVNVFPISRDPSQDIISSVIGGFANIPN